MIGSSPCFQVPACFRLSQEIKASPERLEPFYYHSHQAFFFFLSREGHLDWRVTPSISAVVQISDALSLILPARVSI